VKTAVVVPPAPAGGGPVAPVKTAAPPVPAQAKKTKQQLLAEAAAKRQTAGGKVPKKSGSVAVEAQKAAQQAAAAAALKAAADKKPAAAKKNDAAKKPQAAKPSSNSDAKDPDIEAAIKASLEDPDIDMQTALLLSQGEEEDPDDEFTSWHDRVPCSQGLVEDLNEAHRTPVYVLGDGNCQFRAMAHQFWFSDDVDETNINSSDNPRFTLPEQVRQSLALWGDETQRTELSAPLTPHRYLRLMVVYQMRQFRSMYNPDAWSHSDTVLKLLS